MTDFETRLKELDELERKATAGPWDFPAKFGDCYVCFGEIVNNEIKKAITHRQNEMVLAAPNLEFIAAARNLCRPMLDRIAESELVLAFPQSEKEEKLKEENQKLRDLLSKAKDTLWTCASDVSLYQEISKVLEAK